MRAAQLRLGHVYSWDDLAAVFGFKPNYFGIAGGMPVSAATNSVLPITHPGGGAAFNYRDYWEGKDLICTGRGTDGDQKRTGPNLDVARNRRSLYVFEAAVLATSAISGRRAASRNSPGKRRTGEGV